MDKNKLVVFGVAGLLVYGLWVFVGKKPAKPATVPDEILPESKPDEI